MPRRLLIAIVVAAGAWIAASLVLFVRPPAESTPPAHADAVIVLSGGRDRLPPALALIRKGVAPVLAISTVSRTTHWPLGRHVCGRTRYAGATVICFDAVPYSTRGEARAVERLVRQHQWTSIVVVTSRFHVTRARMIFRRCYDGRLAMVGVPSTWWKLPRDWLDETLKLGYQLTIERGC